jgi:hypothetical protein
LTPEFKAELVGNATTRSFRLIELEENLTWFFGLDYPIPETLTISQWKQLLTFQCKQSRLYYLDAIVDGKENDQALLDQLLEIDSTIYAPLTISQVNNYYFYPRAKL